MFFRGVRSGGSVPSSSRFSEYRIASFSILIAGAVALVGVSFDRLLLAEGVSRLDVRVLSNCLTGIVTGAFFYVFARKQQELHKLLHGRMEIIAEINHHIRNALQVISYYAYREADQRVVQMIRDSVNRIDWALREVLPQFAVMGEPKLPALTPLSTQPADERRETGAAG